MDVDTGQNIFVCTLSIFFPCSNPVITAFFLKYLSCFFYNMFNRIILLKKFFPPFLWIEFNCFKATELLPGDRLLLANKSLRVPNAYLTDLRRMKG